MDRLYDNINTSGNLEIWKVHNDGQEELVFSDHNMIVSGLAAGMMSLFGGIHSNDIRDFQIRYFQIGGGSVDPVTEATVQLASPFTSENYDPSGKASLVISSVDIRLNNDSTTTQDVVQIPWHHIKKVSPTSVLYTLVLDSDSANSLTLTEAGLFLRSPFQVGATPTPVLAAYKTYPAIDKKQQFSLIFKWTIYF